MKAFNFSSSDKIFEDLIEYEFKPDLEILQEIEKTLSWKKTEEQEDEDLYLVEDIKKIYSNGCPSDLFPYVSKNLQIQYLIIQSRINYHLEKLRWNYPRDLDDINI